MDLKIIAGLALLLVFAIMWMQIKIVIKGLYGQNNQGLYVEVILPGRLWKREFSFERFSGGITEGSKPYLKWNQEQEGPGGEILAEQNKRAYLEDINQARHGIIRSLRIFNNLRKNSLFRWWLRAFVPLRSFEWRTTIGFDDAMKTAMTAGFLWAFKGGAVAALGHFSPPARIHFDVVPSFNQPLIESEIKCILMPKISQVMILSLIAWRESKRLDRMA